MKVTMKGKHRGLVPWRTSTLEVTIEAATIEEMKVLLENVKYRFNV